MVDHTLPPGEGLAQVKEFLAYESSTGRFDWIKRPRGAVRWKPGNPAGCARDDGYRVINWQGRQYLAHHLAWWWVYGAWPSRLDHIDRDPSNNAIANLRECSKSQNAGNAKKRVGGTRFRGVTTSTRIKGYRASCAGIHLGCFATTEDAARAYDIAARKRFGEFANLNFPGE